MRSNYHTTTCTNTANGGLLFIELSETKLKLRSPIHAFYIEGGGSRPPQFFLLCLFLLRAFISIKTNPPSTNARKGFSFSVRSEWECIMLCLFHSGFSFKSLLVVSRSYQPYQTTLRAWFCLFMSFYKEN